MKTIPLVDYGALCKKYFAKILSEIDQSFLNGNICQGPSIYNLKKLLEARFNNKLYCSLFKSGGAALEISIRSLNLCPGDEVITYCLHSSIHIGGYFTK